MTCAALTAGLWALGRYVQGDLAWLEVLAMDCAGLAALAADGMLPGYMLFKPLVMVLALAHVAQQAGTNNAGWTRARWLLSAALLFSLAGDVFLMLPGNTFIAGLASFLVAHLFYIALFLQGQRWLPHRGALALVGLVALGMYATLWTGLGDPVLKVAVAAYVLVIALMASQAVGRATVLGTAAAQRVAAGAAIFMVSDATLAINKFVTHVPQASFWILATYYTAQLLILHNATQPDTESGRAQ